MSSREKDDLDRFLRGALSDKLEEKAALFRQLGCLQDLLGVVPASTNDAGSTAGLGPSEGRTRELREGGPCQRPSLPLSF